MQRGSDSVFPRAFVQLSQRAFVSIGDTSTESHLQNADLPTPSPTMALDGSGSGQGFNSVRNACVAVLTQVSACAQPQIFLHRSACRHSGRVLLLRCVLSRETLLLSHLHAFLGLTHFRLLDSHASTPAMLARYDALAWPHASWPCKRTA